MAERTYCTRAVAASVDASPLQAVGVQAFRAFAKHVVPKPGDAASLAASAMALAHVNAALGKMPSLHLYSDWAPPRAPALVPAPGVVPTLAQHGSNKDSSSVAPNVLKDDASMWTSSNMKDDAAGAKCHITLTLPAGARVAGVAIKFGAGAAPRGVKVLAQTDDMRDDAWDTYGVLTGTSALGSQVVVRLTTTISPKKLRLHFEPVRPASSSSSTDVYVSVQHVALLQQEAEATGSPLHDVSKWLNAVLSAALPATGSASVADDSTAGMLRLINVSGSAASLLGLAALLMKSNAFELSPATQSAARTLLASMRSTTRAERTLQNAQDYTCSKALVDGANVMTNGALPAKFDRTEAASNISFQSDTVIKSDSGDYSHCLVDLGIGHGFTQGKASWEFKLVEDTDSQCSCFGAGTRPVTKSNYDSSPSLWMYRSYNGYCYSAGSQTNSSSSTRVFKGQNIRFDLDFDEADGVMRVTINGVDCGIKFTNLRGKELYPAVAFYGSNRTVELVSVTGQRAGPATSSKGTIGVQRPVSMCELTEEHAIVGVGNFGKNGDLGYGSNPDARRVRVGDASVAEALSMHPPKALPPSTSTPAAGAKVAALRASLGDADLLDAVAAAKLDILQAAAADSRTVYAGTATAVYWLGCEYDSFCGSVALNDSASEDLRNASDASPVYFELYGDDKRLWRSNPFHAPKTPSQSFNVSVVGVSVLRLVTRVTDGNSGAYAVWLKPVLNTIAEWGSRGWRNDRRAFVDAISGERREVLASAALTTAASPPTVPDADVKDDVTTSHALALALLQQAGALSEEYMRGVRGTAGSQGGPAPYTLESPFAVEASDALLAAATQLLDSHARASLGPGLNESVQLNTLRVVAVNLRRLLASGINPAAAGLGTATPAARSGSKSSDSLSVVPEVFKPNPTLVQLFDMLERLTTWGGAAHGKPTTDAAPTPSASGTASAEQEQVQEVMWQCVQWSRLLLGSVSATTDLKQHLSKPGVVELQLSLPCEWDDAEGNPIPAESILLQLQLAARKRGWKTRLMGAWPSKVFLIVDVSSTSINSFFSGDVEAAFAAVESAGVWTDKTRLPIVLERSTSFDRLRRFTLEPFEAVVRVYPSFVGGFDDVVAALRDFVPSA